MSNIQDIRFQYFLGFIKLIEPFHMNKTLLNLSPFILCRRLCRCISFAAIEPEYTHNDEAFYLRNFRSQNYYVSVSLLIQRI